MKKNQIIISLAGALVLGLVVLSVTGTGVSANENTVTANIVKNVGDVQKVQLTFENYEYKLTPSTLVKDVPVELIVDMNSVYGCMRDVVISAFDVRQYVSEGNNVIRFTPDKTGTFNIACSMNMGRGKFTVAESDGTTSDFVEEAPAQAAGGSCGSAGGSCGCGGA